MGFSDRVAEAFAYASRLHSDQVRKGTGIPYVTHLMSVAALVAEYGGTEEQVIAGLLHDAVEDQGGPPTLADIRSRFGDAVADIVASCSDTDRVPKPPWRERKEAYIAHLAGAPAEALLVSAADKVHNARSLVADLHREGAATLRRFTGGPDGTLWYYRSLVTALRARAVGPIVDELDRRVREMETLAR